MRKLASVQKVWDVVPIEGADRIELVKILGWQCVANKGVFKKGDLAVYFEVDAFLPLGDERWAFLEKTSYRKSEILGEGLRIRTQKFLGQISQGLAIPLSAFPEFEGMGPGSDVTKALGVRKWEVPETVTSAGTSIGKKPYGIPTTDETRSQSDGSLREQLLGKPYVITTKMDGTSCTMYAVGGKFGVCGRNMEYKDDGKCDMWKYAHERGVPEKLLSYGEDIVLQGEFCGPGIQKNRLKLNKPEWYVFNMLTPKEGGGWRLSGYSGMSSVCGAMGLQCVPLEERGESFSYSPEGLLGRARGKYERGGNKEGIVVRPEEPEDEYCEALGKPLSFKVLNNDYLLKEK